MTFVLDTHLLLWWFAQGSLSAGQRRIIRRATALHPLWVSDISLWEIATLVELGRVRLRLPLREWLDRATTAPLVMRHGISPAVAAEVADFPVNAGRLQWSVGAAAEAQAPLRPPIRTLAVNSRQLRVERAGFRMRSRDRPQLHRCSVRAGPFVGANRHLDCALPTVDFVGYFPIEAKSRNRQWHRPSSLPAPTGRKPSQPREPAPV